LARPRKPSIAAIVEVYAMFFALLFGLSLWAARSDVAQVPAIQESRKLLFGIAALVPVAFMVAVVYGWSGDTPPKKRVPDEATRADSN
jgi:uncharacterized protein involved in response to NO